MSAKMVKYATPQGKTFHVYLDCPGSNRWQKEVDTRVILLRRLRPCKKCHPAPSVEVSHIEEGAHDKGGE
jgi:hypothetical protein